MTDDSELLSAIRDLRRDMREDLASAKSELAASLQAGLSAVNLAIASLTDAHHRAVLEQERRNADFATRRQLDVTDARMGDISSNLATHDAQILGLQRRTDELLVCTDEIKRDSTATKLGVLKGALGYVILTAISIASALAGAGLDHALFHK